MDKSIQKNHHRRSMDLKQLIGESSEYDKKQALEEKRPKSWLKSVSPLEIGISDETGDAE